MQKPADDSMEPEQLKERIADLERELTLLKLHTGADVEQDRTLFENTGTATIIVEADTTIVLANAKFCQLLEMTREEIEGKVKWPQYVHSVDRARMVSYHERRRKEGEEVPRSYSFRLISAKGTERSIYVTIDLIPGSTRSIASMSDITELNLLQSALIESEERYRSLSEAALDMIVTLDMKGNFNYANHAALVWTGLSERELMNRSVFEFIHDDDKERVRSLLNLDESVINANHHYEIQLINGTFPIHGEVGISVIRKPDETQEVLTVIRDITPRREAEELLRTSEERLRTVLSEMPVMLVARDENDLISTWNSECERVTGWKADEMLNNPEVDDLLYPDETYRRGIRDELHQSKKSYRNAEIRIQCKDGSSRIISWSDISKTVPVPGWAYWGIGIDVTDLRAAEQQIRAAEKLSVAQELAATVAHEFRQPLASLQLATDLAEMTMQDTKEHQRHHKLIRDAVNRIDTLVSRLLTITQVESRPYALSMNILDLEKSSSNGESEGEETTK